MRLIIAIAVLVWLASIAFSRKKMKAMKEKDGFMGVLIVLTTLLFFVSMFVVIAAVIYAGETRTYEFLDISSVVFFSVTGILVLEFVIAMALKKNNKI